MLTVIMPWSMLSKRTTRVIAKVCASHPISSRRPTCASLNTEYHSSAIVFSLLISLLQNEFATKWAHEQTTSLFITVNEPTKRKLQKQENKTYSIAETTTCCEPSGSRWRNSNDPPCKYFAKGSESTSWNQHFVVVFLTKSCFRKVIRLSHEKTKTLLTGRSHVKTKMTVRNTSDRFECCFSSKTAKKDQN